MYSFSDLSRHSNSDSLKHLIVCWGGEKMFKISDNSRQPNWEAWTMERLNAGLTINLGMAIDHSTHNNYPSTLNLYLTFCHLHNLDVEPTLYNLALFVTFQSTFINPKSVNSYFSGIVNQLETHFPDVQVAYKSALVTCALQGAKHCHGVPTAWKLPLTRNNLITVTNAYQYNPTYDDILFITQLLTGFNCLLHLGELTWPDKLDLCNYQKVSMWHMVEFLADSLSFWLPGHKADQYFEGNCLIICKHSTPTLTPFLCDTLILVTSIFRPDLNFGCMLMEQSPLAHNLSTAYSTFYPVPSLSNQCRWEVLRHLQNRVLH